MNDFQDRPSCPVNGVLISMISPPAPIKGDLNVCLAYAMGGVFYNVVSNRGQPAGRDLCPVSGKTNSARREMFMFKKTTIEGEIFCHHFRYEEEDVFLENLERMLFHFGRIFDCFFRGINFLALYYFGG